MTKINNEQNSDGLRPLIGLASPAYRGAPHGVAQVSLSNPELRSPKRDWSLKTKRQRRQELLDSL
jgi:hypothetical protein